MEWFGIVSPRLGQRKDAPTILIDDAFSAESEGVRVVDSTIQKLPGRLLELADENGDAIALPETVLAVVAFAAGAVEVATDVTADFGAGVVFRVNGSTDNDGLYTVASSSYSAPNTTIVIEEDFDTGNDDGNVFLGATPALRYHTLTSAGQEYLAVLTAYNIFEWMPTTGVLNPIWTVVAGAGCTAWDSASFNGKMIATNFSDQPLTWTPGDPAEEMTFPGALGTVLAKFVTEFENYLILAYMSESGSTYQSRIRWSDLGDETTWDSGDADAADNTMDVPITGRIGKPGSLY